MLSLHSETRLYLRGLYRTTEDTNVTNNPHFTVKEIIEDKFDLEVINSSSNDDHIISEESLEAFQTKINKPDPERVKVRNKTLERAKRIYEKYKDNL